MKIIRSLFANPAIVLKIVRYKIFRVVGGREFRPFIVLSRSRTGSNLLVTYLNSHPNIYCKGEMFGRLNGRNYKSVLRVFLSKQPFYVRAAGFKLFYYHPMDVEGCPIFDDLERMKELRVIHLKRRNVLRTITSWKIAQSQNIRIQIRPDSGIPAEKKAIHFDVEELKSWFVKTKAWEDDADDRFHNHSMETIYFEDLVKNPGREFRRVAELLGVRFVPPRTGLHRQNPENVEDLITNYGELKLAFRSTRWSSYFED